MFAFDILLLLAVFCLLGAHTAGTQHDPQNSRLQQALLPFAHGARPTPQSCKGCHQIYTYRKAWQWYNVHGDTSRTTLRPGVVQCLKAIDLEDTAPNKTAGSVAVVMSHSPNITFGVLTQAVIASWKAYCKRHGCTFVHNIVPPAEQHFFSARWVSLLQEGLWGKYDWILHVDDDVMVVNMTRSLRPYMRHNSPHVSFAMREQFDEVAAGAIIFRTTPFTACFLKYWGDLGLVPRSNWDNGDLAQAALDFVDPDLAMYCDTVRPPLNAQGRMGDPEWKAYNEIYLKCFQRIHMALPYVHLALPIRFHYAMTGYFHGMQGHRPSKLVTSTHQALWEGLYRHCWSTDFLRHGYKEVGRLWLRRQAPKKYAPCARLAPDSELLIAQRCCLWHYKGCLSNSTGYNTCRHQPHCLQSLTGMVGMPIRECQEFNTPWFRVQAKNVTPYLRPLPVRNRAGAVKVP